VLIAGPTASGKSRLALDMAQKLGGTIINADSMQVYRDLRILTARPSPTEEKLAPHRLYGHVDAAENYSVGRWLEDVKGVLNEAQQVRSLPIVVGGTGLYFLALTCGLATIPSTPIQVRSALRARLAARGVHALHEELARGDPITAARLHRNDRVRILRALEVAETTGRSLSDWHRAAMPALIDARAAIKVFLEVERTELYRRIDLRLEEMMRSGGIEEVRALAQRGLDPLLPAMKAHGVPSIIRALGSELALIDALESAKRDTRRYTKRQRTWFRHQLPDWPWMMAADAERAILEANDGS
jgi:tRNA dimethylallyltransferase